MFGNHPMPVESIDFKNEGEERERGEKEGKKREEGRAQCRLSLVMLFKNIFSAFSSFSDPPKVLIVSLFQCLYRFLDATDHQTSVWILWQTRS